MLLLVALACVDDGACPAGAVGGGAFCVAAAAAEDGKGVHFAVFGGLVFGVVVDGDADVVGHEADGEGVEEGFQEG